LLNPRRDLMENFKYGDRVTITSGMTEFVGKTGRVVSKEKMGKYEPPYFRVQLDQPVAVPGVGNVYDDLWQGVYLKRVK
jgi:hypothetical protein